MCRFLSELFLSCCWRYILTMWNVSLSLTFHSLIHHASHYSVFLLFFAPLSVPFFFVPCCHEQRKSLGLVQWTMSIDGQTIVRLVAMTNVRSGVFNSGCRSFLVVLLIESLQYIANERSNAQENFFKFLFGISSPILKKNFRKIHFSI